MVFLAFHLNQTAIFSAQAFAGKLTARSSTSTGRRNIVKKTKIVEKETKEGGPTGKNGKRRSIRDILQLREKWKVFAAVAVKRGGEGGSGERAKEPR